MATTKHAHDATSTTLITVKAQVPPLRAGLVSRERLVDRLLNGEPGPLTVVIAPAGWGKTTLLSQWVRRIDQTCAVAWVSLDEYDDEPVRFWTYALSALHKAAPTVAKGPLLALGAPGVDPVDVSLPMLLNSLAASTRPHVLVFDDFHVLTDHHLHSQMEFLLAYAPPSLRVVIAGRSDPPLPLARLRAAGQLTEVRAEDLRFTADEASALVTKVAEVDLPGKITKRMLSQTEGWATGLQLTALSLREAPDPVQRVAEIHGDDRHLLDYFGAEVLSRATEPQRQLLVRCSVLERLCGPLCDAVLERSDSAAVLMELERSNFFVAGIDDRREWYRCHRLFRDALRRELDLIGPDQASSLLVRAADWFLGEGHVEEAVRHRLAAHDGEEAARLLATSVQWFVDRGAFLTYLRLGAQVPSSVAHQHPDLCVALAWAAALTGQVEIVRPWLDAAESTLTDESRPLHGWSNLRAAARTVRAISGHLGEPDHSAAIADAEESVALETDPTLPGSAVARMTLGRVLQAAGEPEAAIEVLGEAMRLPATSRAPVILRLQAAGSLACALLDKDRATQADRVCRAADESAAALEERWSDAAGPVLTLLRTAQGRVAYARGDLDEAVGLLTRAVDLGRVCGDASHEVLALIFLAQAQLAAGDPQASTAALAEARDTVESEWTTSAAQHELVRTEERLGRTSSSQARRGAPRPLAEELTERELSILRALQGQLSQREIGAEMYLSLNTVKGYTKSLYRKLDVSSRQAAVQRGRVLGLI